MATEPFPVSPDELLLGTLAALGVVIGLGLLAFLIHWAWGLPERMPSKLRSLQERHESALREAHQESSRRAQLAEKGRKDVEALQAELAKQRGELATLQAVLEESRQQGSRLEAKALQAVQEATAKEAALAAKARKLEQDLVAANIAVAEASEAYRQLAVAAKELKVRHDETLGDLRKLRDCDHQEQATVYTRETDPATGHRPYRSQGLLCKRCHYVQAGPQVLPVQAVAAVADGNGSL